MNQESALADNAQWVHEKSAEVYFLKIDFFLIYFRLELNKLMVIKIQ